MSDLETGWRWWMRHVIVPLLAGSGVIGAVALYFKLSQPGQFFDSRPPIDLSTPSPSPFATVTPKANSPTPTPASTPMATPPPAATVAPSSTSPPHSTATPARLTVFAPTPSSTSASRDGTERLREDLRRSFSEGRKDHDLPPSASPNQSQGFYHVRIRNVTMSTISYLVDRGHGWERNSLEPGFVRVHWWTSPRLAVIHPDTSQGVDRSEWILKPMFFDHVIESNDRQSNEIPLYEFQYNTNRQLTLH